MENGVACSNNNNNANSAHPHRRRGPQMMMTQTQSMNLMNPTPGGPTTAPNTHSSSSSSSTPTGGGIPRLPPPPLNPARPESHPDQPPEEPPASARRSTIRVPGTGTTGAPMPPGGGDHKVVVTRDGGKEQLPPHLDLSGPPKCSGCGQQIADRYLNHVLGSFWHAACLVCVECRLPLQKSCFQNEGKLYCGVHFFRRFGTRCRGCGEGIPPSEMVRRAHDNVYHLTCFTCAVCDQQLDTGDHFYLRTDHSLVCRADFERARQGCSTATDEDDDDSNAPSTKRPRASINNKQLEELKNTYNVSRKPSRSLREELGKKLGLDVRVVQVWFQNRRAKEKRLKREVVPTSPFGTHQDAFPVPVSGVDDVDPHQAPGFHIPGKHAMQLPLQDSVQADFYPKLEGPGPSVGTEATSGVSIPNHPSPGCCSSVGGATSNPAAGPGTWNCHPYMDCPPGQRDAFSSPPHHNQYLQGGGGGAPGGGAGGQRGAEDAGISSSGFPHTAVHGAVVCTNGGTSPPGGNNVNYEQSPDKGWLPSQQAPGFAENVNAAMNGPYHFHNL